MLIAHTVNKTEQNFSDTQVVIQNYYEVSSVTVCNYSAVCAQKKCRELCTYISRNTKFFYDSLLISQQILYLLQQINH